MGTLSFALPRSAPVAAGDDLDRACMAGGYDNMPTPTQVVRDPQTLRLNRDVDESGYLLTPWEISTIGRVMSSTATLVERAAPYQLVVELARGKLNQLRGQASDWRMVGLQIPDELDAQIRECARRFGRAVTSPTASDAETDALAALDAAYNAANDLVRAYIEQMFSARHQRQPKLDSILGVRLNGLVPPAAEKAVVAAFSSVSAPMTWKSIEPTESQYNWTAADATIAWALKQGLKVTAGPLVDFSHAGLPDWLWLWEGDLPSLSSFMCDYVETAVGRYHKQIRRWHLTAASNIGAVLKLSEDDLLWLTARLAEAAWQIDPELELVVGIAQPWGDYMARAEYTYSPFVYADTLIRAGLKLAALDVEWAMGVSPRGSYCRDLLEASRLLDMYAMLGTPLQVSMAYPSASGADSLADPKQSAEAGFWLDGFTPDSQSDWAAEFAALALCKPFVRSAYWAHLNDAETHHFPHCGLLDRAGKSKPALDRLRRLRSEHLK